MKTRSLAAPLVLRLTATNWPPTLAGFLLVATGLITLVNIAIWAGQDFAPPPVSFIRGQSVFWAEMFYAISYAAMGWLLASRLWRNALGWIFILLGLFMTLQLSVTFLVQESQMQLSYPLLVAAWVSSSFHLPSIVVLTTIVFARFPNGRPLTPRWRIAGWLAFFGSLALAIGIGLRPGALAWYPTSPNVFGVSADYSPLLDGLVILGLAVMITGFSLSAISMVLRYQRSESVERAQLRWIAVAVVLLSAAGIPFLIGRYALQIDYAVGELLISVALIAGCFLPIAAAIAVLRHRLYDIDIIIKKAFVYIPLSAILAGIYAAGVTLMQRVFLAVTGDTSDAAVVMATLILASLFTPIRNWIQAFVDRYFKPDQGHTFTEDVALTVDQRVALLEARVARMEVGAYTRSHDR